MDSAANTECDMPILSVYGLQEGDGDIEQARGFEPSMSLPRERRQVIGAQCKRLIDAGRRHYLRENGFSNADAVQYVDGKVSGENWLLLAP